MVNIKYIRNKLILFSEYVQNIICMKWHTKSPQESHWWKLHNPRWPPEYFRNIKANNFPTNCHKKATLVSKHRFSSMGNRIINGRRLLISIKSRCPSELNHKGLPWYNVVADYGGVYCFMFCRHVCTYMVYVSLYRWAHSVCVSIYDWNRRISRRTNQVKRRQS